MTVYEATMIAEGATEADEETQIEAWQFLIDFGLVWSLQGWFGRRACELIAKGTCTTANADAIPPRAQELIDLIGGAK